jgi:hypothetical protein
MKKSRLEKNCENVDLKDLISDGIITTTLVACGGYYFGGYKGALIGVGTGLLMFGGAAMEEYYKPRKK